MFEYQREGNVFVKCAGGLEEPLARELDALGCERVEPQYLGVSVRTDMRTLYRMVLESRLASHVLAPLTRFPCRNEHELYDEIKKRDWSMILDCDRTFAIMSHVWDSRITHGRYAAQKMKDAIADRFVEQEGRRPSVDRDDPDVWLDLNIRSNHATVSIDASRGAMHRRGYRKQSVEAPMQETLAAAILTGARWHGERPLYDPMCGSGTVLAEGLMMAGNVPAGFRRCKRTAPVSSMPDYDQGLWDKVRAQAEAARVELPVGLVAGSDLDRDAIKATRANLRRVPGGSEVPLSRVDFRDLDGVENALIVTNPPYGVRLEDKRTAAGIFEDLGNWLKRKCTGSTAWVLCGDKELVGALGLRPKRKIPIRNGGLECVLVELELY
jgi:putative N6-adenine-specific DNA methylase